MPYINRTPKGALSLALTVVLILFASSSEGLELEQSELESIMTVLKTKLESGVSFDAEKPLVLRPFRPHTDDNWTGHAVAYGCYRAGQAPGQKGPSEAELLEDLQIISKHWNLIRVYGADDDTRRILQVIEAHNLPIKVIQGIWLSPEEDNPQEKAANIHSVLLGIELANQYRDIVIAVSVGNETQVFWSGHRMEVANLVRYIRAVRQSVLVPVTTADDYLFWNKPESRLVAEETDFVFTHIHPMWNGKTLAGAIGWMDETYRELQELHPDRMIVVGETGWATDYNATKTGPDEQGTLVKGEVGLDAQAAFLIKMDQWIESNKVTIFLFEVFDEPWKGGGKNSSPNEIEKNWGVFNEDRTPKESLLKYLDHRRNKTD